MRIAFKEWAAIVEALGSGRQILILRKGGIREGRRGFQVEHAEFLLYPTYFHQQREMLLPHDSAPGPGPGPGGPELPTVRLQFFAHVVSWRKLESMAAAERLRGQHLWRDEVIASRFNWSRDKNIHALAVRVFQLPHPILLPAAPSHRGCKSWIELAEEVVTDDAIPVLSKEAFNAKLEEFHAALDAEGSIPAAAAPPS